MIIVLNIHVSYIFEKCICYSNNIFEFEGD